MAEPTRLRLSRKKGFNLQEHSKAVNGLVAVNVARPSRWGNRHKVGDHPFGDKLCEPMSALDAVERFEAQDCSWPGFRNEIRLALRGKNLACWCKPDQPCHADILLKIANSETEQVSK